jgi:hypothetical protein
LGDGGGGSDIDDAEMCAGKDDSDDAAWCLGGASEDVGPLYATGLAERDAVRNERYCPTLGM